MCSGYYGDLNSSSGHEKRPRPAESQAGRGNRAAREDGRIIPRDTLIPSKSVFGKVQAVLASRLSSRQTGRKWANRHRSPYGYQRSLASTFESGYSSRHPLSSS
jgi:hypothetical protein